MMEGSSVMRQDTYKLKGQRRLMVQHIRQKGITDERVLAAMERVPRHFFFDPALEGHAYEDIAIPIACDQTISHPSTVAFQSQLLEVEPLMKVLEVGTGSGYQTAILCSMGARVWTIERQKELFEKTRRLLSDLRYQANCYLGDGYQGLTEVDFGPYDRIIITCGASHIPSSLVDQLRVGGMMVIPVGQDEQQMIRVKKTPQGIEQEQYGIFRFVPMLKGRQF